MISVSVCVLYKLFSKFMTVSKIGRQTPRIVDQ